MTRRGQILRNLVIRKYTHKNYISQDANHIHIFCDGGITTNPGGTATFGWIARQGQHIIAQDSGIIGTGEGMTNNIAEYQALIQALQWAASLSPSQIFIYSDSQLIVNQVNKTWRCHSADLAPLQHKARTLLKSVNATLCWTPRENNAEADRLAFEALQKPSNAL